MPFSRIWHPRSSEKTQAFAFANPRRGNVGFYNREAALQDIIRTNNKKRDQHVGIMLWLLHVSLL
jgi:hypothetical protein